MSNLRKLDPQKQLPSFDGEGIAKALIKKLINNVGVIEVYLFGSCLTGENDIDSDIDILITVKDLDQVKVAYKTVQSPFYSPVAVDWIIKTADDFEKQKYQGGISFIAYHHGRKLYP